MGIYVGVSVDGLYEGICVTALVETKTGRRLGILLVVAIVGFADCDSVMV